MGEEYVGFVALVDISLNAKMFEMQRDILARSKVNVDTLIASPLSSWGIKGVPSVMYVDAHGIVANVWTGQLLEEVHEEVLSFRN